MTKTLGSALQSLLRLRKIRGPCPPLVKRMESPFTGKMKRMESPFWDWIFPDEEPRRGSFSNRGGKSSSSDSCHITSGPQELFELPPISGGLPPPPPSAAANGVAIIRPASCTPSGCFRIADLVIRAGGGGAGLISRPSLRLAVTIFCCRVRC